MEMPSLALAILIATAMATVPSYASLVTFVFGDSLTEVGNNNFLQLSLAKSNYPYYGVDYTGGQPTGRFTNGRTIGDIISAKLGIPSPPPYLSLSSNDDTILKGVNYASGGAGILNDTGLYFIQRLSFDDQINNFKKTKDTIKTKLGGEAANKLCNEALYFIGIGSNDYVNNFLQPFLADEALPIGCKKDGLPWTWTPRLHSFTKGEIKERAMLKAVNQWALQFNSRVQNLITSLNQRLPTAQMAFADTYPAVLDLITNPKAYGFKVSNTSCCNVDTSIGGLCLPNSKLCSNRSEYVFWDAFHPSDAANAVLAERLFSSLLTSAPSAAPLPSQ